MAYFKSNEMIIDPDFLFYYAGASGSAPASANLIIDYTTETATGGGTIQVRAVSGLTAEGGVTLKCLYSKLKEVWKSDATLIKFPFPMLPITDEQFELINGWDFKDATSKQYMRTGGWALKSYDGTTTLEEYAGVITLGTLADLADQIYYTQEVLGSPTVTGTTTNFVLTGPVNQAVKVYGSATYGNFDYKSYLKLFCREYGKTYANSTLTDIGVTTLTYQCYRFPVTTTTDLKAINTNPTTGAIYGGMSIKWESAPVDYVTGAVTAAYNITINASGGTAQQVYEFVQYALRHNQRTDIDANSGATYVKYGEVTPDLLRFVGDTLYVIYQSVGPTGGIFINNISDVDKNSVYFYDNTNTQRFYPYQASLRLQFGDNIVADPTTKFTVFYTSVPSGSFGTANAVIVKDVLGTDISYVIANSASSATWISNKYADFSFDYDGNTQGGRTFGTDAAITVVALGLSTAQYVKATGNIAKSKANAVSLVASLERNYQNP